MTKEEAIKRMESMRWEHATNPCPDRTAFDMAISALSTEGEYIKKSELLQHVTTEELSDYKDCDVIHAEEIDKLTTYSFPDSAENKGEWIPVNGIEDIPKSGSYWVTKEYGYDTLVEKIRWSDAWRCWVEMDDDSVMTKESAEIITAYMPYFEPEPYKKGE